MYKTINLNIAKGVATLTLNRPERLNSFTLEMHAECKQALKEIKTNKSVRCLLITGNGRGFCAGQDLGERKFVEGTTTDLGESLEKRYNPLIKTIRTLNYPVVCAVNGVAAGAGANIALAADIVLAARSAKFIQPFCKLGLIPDAGGTWVLPRLVGHAKAMALALTGEEVSAVEAERIGMIWRCVDDETLMGEAEKLASHFSKQPTYGLAMIKRAISASLNNSLDEQLSLEKDLQRLCGMTSDYKEGVTAFKEKRKPRFKGK